MNSVDSIHVHLFIFRSSSFIDIHHTHIKIYTGAELQLSKPASSRLCNSRSIFNQHRHVLDCPRNISCSAIVIRNVVDPIMLF